MKKIIKSITYKSQGDKLKVIYTFDKKQLKNYDKLKELYKESSKAQKKLDNIKKVRRKKRDKGASAYEMETMNRIVRSYQKELNTILEKRVKLREKFDSKVITKTNYINGDKKEQTKNEDNLSPFRINKFKNYDLRYTLLALKDAISGSGEQVKSGEYRIYDVQSGYSLAQMYPDYVDFEIISVKKISV